MLRVKVVMVMVVWMVVLLTAQVQCVYDFVHVVCTCAFLCIVLTEVFRVTASTCLLVCLCSFQLLCLKCESTSIRVAV